MPLSVFNFSTSEKGSAGDIAALCAGQVSTQDFLHIPWTKVDSAIPTGAEMFTLGVDITNISSQRPAPPWGVQLGLQQHSGFKYQMGDKVAVYNITMPTFLATLLLTIAII
ncbi:hypothetical protein ASPFODRAFT_51530 [Aspergillus luchuensis CBS 106.47]|uniref:Uncharacterized protein n=1 Tax=Aspergillus luchuensis (strain CBS 106.47) TaxID=1137211 RepID=A0A1M3T514_ASPLC|nr:hypothetical protein ASPFODRAFT_51530 [Aspergillus luchuensis CBS 106.47]